MHAGGDVPAAQTCRALLDIEDQPSQVAGASRDASKLWHSEVDLDWISEAQFTQQLAQIHGHAWSIM